MPASYPGAVKTFTSRSAGQTIDPSHINDLQDEVNALESGLLNGTAPVTSSRASVQGLNVAGNSTLGSTITIGSVTHIFSTAVGSTGQALGITAVSGSTRTIGPITITTAPRVDSTTTASAYTPNADTTDVVDLTALASSITFSTPSGTPANGQRLMFRIKDNGSSRQLNFSTSYVSGGVPLPTATTVSKWLHLGWMYNASGSSRWYLVARTDEP